jgi:hypothetical protein
MLHPRPSRPNQFSAGHALLRKTFVTEDVTSQALTFEPERTQQEWPLNKAALP